MLRLLPYMLLSLTAVATANADCSDAERKALEDFDRAWGEAGRTGDKAALEKIYADDYRDMALGGPSNKAETIAETLADAERNRNDPAAAKVVPDHYMFHCTANGATITHRNTISGMDNGKAWTEYRRSVHTLEKRRGGWQVVGNAGHALDDAGKLFYFELDWNAADINHDVAWFEHNFADDYSGVASRTGALSDKAAEIADVKAPKVNATWAELSEFDARVEGDTAVVTGINHAKGKDDKNQAFDRRIRFTDVFIKRDGRWQVWATQGTLIVDKK